MIRSYSLPLAAAAILISAAVAHGLRTDRWGGTADLDAAVGRLESLPMNIGDWEGAVVELPQEQLRAANVSGLVARRYMHRHTRDEVTLLLLCGRPGPVCVHTPDVCYSAIGFTMGSTRIEPLPDKVGNAWVADFKNSGPQPQTLRIRWAWSQDGRWTASGSPRTEFARARILHKLYLVRTVTLGDSKGESPEVGFFRDIQPTLQSLFATP